MRLPLYVAHASVSCKLERHSKISSPRGKFFLQVCGCLLKGVLWTAGIDGERGHLPIA